MQDKMFRVSHFRPITKITHFGLNPFWPVTRPTYFCCLYCILLKIWVEVIRINKHTNCHIRFRISSCPAFVVFNHRHHFDECSIRTCLMWSLFVVPSLLPISSAVYKSFDNDMPSWRNTSHISFNLDSKDSIYLAICLRHLKKVHQNTFLVYHSSKLCCLFLPVLVISLVL